MSLFEDIDLLTPMQRRKAKEQKQAADFVAYCRASGVPAPVREYHFCDGRQWRADFAWPEQMIILEVQGGAFVNGGHTRGPAYVKEMERTNTAALLGWRMFFTTPKNLMTELTMRMLKQALGLHPVEPSLIAIPKPKKQRTKKLNLKGNK